MQKIIVDKKCIACGQCVMRTEFLVEADNGQAVPKAEGIINDAEAGELQDIAQDCPVKAINFEKIFEYSGNEKEQLKNIQAELCAFAKYQITRPKKEDFYCPKEELQIVKPTAGLRSRYSYRSYEQAEREGLRAFGELVHSQKHALTQSVIVNYKKRYLDSYSRDDENDSSYYFAECQKISQKLQGFAKTIEEITGGQLKIDNNLLNFKVYLKDFKIIGYQTKCFEETYVCSRALENVEALSWYDTYINSDERELSTRSVSCYDLHEAVDTICKHIIDGCDSAIKEIVPEMIEKLLDWYQGLVTKEMDKVIGEINKSIDRYIQK